MSIDMTHEPDIGYLFYPSDQPNHPGHPRLDVIIPAKPTERHFDPQTAVFQTHSVTQGIDIEHTHIHHPWTMQKEMRVVAGRIFIKDRKQKRVEAFSFGGSLIIATDKRQTVCVLQSPAPIFPLFSTQGVAAWLVDEVEILFAQRRVQWEQNHHSFEARLAATEPAPLYLACLAAIRSKFENQTRHFDKTTHQGVQFIGEEISRLQENPQFPQAIPALEAVL